MSSPSSVEKSHSLQSSEEEHVGGVSFTAKQDAAITRKVDLRLLVILGALYSIALVDRINVSAARVSGMAEDLQLTVGERYSIVTLVFAIPYIIFQLPSNILLRKIGTRNHLTSLVVLWGGVTLGMGFINTWEQLVVCRVLLGLLEAGFFPGCVFLISCWYTRFQTHKRIAVFYLTSIVIAGFSNVMGYGITKLGGRHGIAPWRWIFIVFGCVTIGLGIIAWFCLVDFPDKNTFLTPDETAHVINKINVDRGDAEPDELTWARAKKHLRDYRLWCFGLLLMATSTPVQAFSYFLPVILAGGGFSRELSLILSAPPYVFAAIYTFSIAYFSDRSHRRAAFIALNATVCIVGLVIMGFGGKIGVRYFGSFLAMAGCQANVPAILAYQANNILTHSKRAIASAMTIGFAGIGGMIASAVYREKDTPNYIPGISATIGSQVLILLVLALLTFEFSRTNKKVDAGEVVVEEKPGFKYTL